jgi:hypothetical protein
MSEKAQGGSRLAEAVRLRDAALALLRREGKASQDGRGLEFEPITAGNSYPRLSLLLTKHPLDGRSMLNVWAMGKRKYEKVLNIEWLGGKFEVVSFRRGEWEPELLAMGPFAPGLFSSQRTPVISRAKAMSRAAR